MPPESQLVASLPMYDLPELRGATDAWWAGLARAFEGEGFAEPPRQLTRDFERPGELEAHWRNPNLLFSQTCGYPLTHGLDEALQIVSTPVYDAARCTGASYRSLLVVRAEDPATELAELAGRRAAINARDSHSGCNVLRATVAELAGGRPYFSEVIETGSHLRSLAAVAESRADLAAIDCVTFALLARHAAALIAGLRVLTASEAAPSLPYVTAAGRPSEEVARLRRGLRKACADPALAGARDLLLIRGVEALPRSAYRRIDEIEESARSRGYPELS